MPVPSVSVIIPCYNHGHYLPFAVDSVLAQTFADWEAIIVDDGSTDATRTVAGQYTDPRIRCVFQQNQGLSAARNTGICLAQGKYLVFLDADDAWEPGFLATCLAALPDDTSLAGVYVQTYFMDQTGALLPKVGIEPVPALAFRSRLLEGGFFPVHAALVYTRCVHAAGLFDTHLTSLEDWDLWLRISRHWQMAGLPQCLVRYRVSSGSMSTHAGRMQANRLAVLAKHFGPAAGEPAAWPNEKRLAYAFAYRLAALGYLEQQEPITAWQWLDTAAQTWPSILTRLDTFYELALGDQPKGLRGEVELVNLEINAATMLAWLARFFAGPGHSQQEWRGQAYGNAYLALAMLYDQAGKWAVARRFLRRAIWVHPKLLRNPSVIRRLFKLSIGQRLAANLRQARRQLALGPTE